MDLQDIQGSIETPVILIAVQTASINGGEILFYFNDKLISKDFSALKEDKVALQKAVLKYIDETFRKAEKELISIPTEIDGEIFLMIYDLRYPTKVQAVCGLGTTFLVCMVLGSGAMIFSKLTTDLVITPIEDMIERVNGITEDPIKAAHNEEERLLYEEMAEK